MAGWVLTVFLALGAVVSAVEDVAFLEDVRDRFATRIVAGWEAQDGQFPYQLALRMVTAVGGVSACGASIIHSQWGLTAAHCTATRVSVVIRAGTVNMTRPNMIFETTEYYNHPLYNSNLPQVVQPHDICLLKFPVHITFNELVQPIRLQSFADRDRNYEGIRLTASGWGTTWSGGSSPENLNWVYLTGVTNNQCLSHYGNTVVDSTICTLGYNNTDQSTCQGDSGGPLTVVDDDGEVSQVGIASFVSGQGCHVDLPAGFIRPGHYHYWYLEITGIDFDWEQETEPESPITVAPEHSTTESDNPEGPVTVNSLQQ